MIIKACPGHPLLLGRLGENLAREIVFVDEVAAWLSEYPNAVIGLLNQRPSDTQGYPVARAVVSDGALHWTVTNTDLSAEGNGRCELVATDNGVVVKSAIYDTIILTALDGSGETPEPWEDWREYFAGLKGDAEAAAETAQISASESLGRANAALQYSLNASQSANNAAGSAHEASRYAVEAEHTARDVQHSAEDAAFYASLAANSNREAQTASASARSAATAAAESAAQITGLTAAAETLPEGSAATAQYDAETGVLTLGIPTGATGAQGPQGDPGEDYVLTEADKAEIAEMVNAPVTDVQIDGSSIVQDGVADIPTGSTSAYGVYRSATVAVIKAGTALDRVPTVGRQNSSVFYGLASAAGDTTQSVSDNAVGTYTAEAKAAIQTMLDVPSASGVVTDVQINGSSIVENGVANVPLGSTSTYGVIKLNQYGGLQIGSDGMLKTAPAQPGHTKAGTETNKPIVPEHQHESAFYGLAKAAGDTTQSASSNAVGEYTDDAKVAIQKMLGIYEAPWELIREDTGTYATSQAIEIVADSNGQSFELTDIRIMFTTPTQETAAAVASPGRVRCYYDNTNSDVLYIGSYAQAAQAAGRVSAVQIIQKDGMIERYNWKNQTDNDEKSPVSLMTSSGGTAIWQLASKTYNKVVIEGVTGTWKYFFYGKRKWN